MMKRKILTPLIALALSIVAVFGCFGTVACKKDDPKPTALAAPVVTLDGSTLKWDAVEHATGYTVKEGATAVSENQKETSYAITKTEPGSYSYTVTALSTDDKYTSSPASTAVTYTVAPSEPEPALAAPALRLRGTTLKWGAVEDAEGYDVYYKYKDGEPVKASSLQPDLSYSVSHEDVGEYTYWVVAVSKALNLESQSNTVKYVKTAPALDKPVLTLSENTITWTAVQNADGYSVKDKDGNTSTLTACSYTFTAPTEVGTYYYSVTATTENANYSNSVTSVIAYTVNDTRMGNASTKLASSKIYVVGDSTVCGFSDSYYLPRYGYGTQLANYLDLTSSSQIVNLAMSGRSSYSFLSEANYTTLKNDISSGDYLIIGFGHNDEKAEDERYTNPNLPTDDSTTKIANRAASFKYTLYENYVKLAENKGATAILCTPIVRLNASNDYTGSNAHITTSSNSKYPGGDYAQAIRDLGAEKSVQVVDLTAATAADYTALGYDEASNYHAWTSTSNGVRSGVDGTHTNMYGAKMNAYLIASALKLSDCPLGANVKANITRPTYAADYAGAINSSYVEPQYTPFTSSKKSTKWSVTAPNWYGTVFGEVGGDAKITTSNFTVKQGADAQTFIVNSNKKDSGKIQAASDGIAAAFMQIDCDQNFEISATVKIDAYIGENSQSGFGIMLRDDIYIDKSFSADGNYVAAGCYGLGSSANILFSREGKALTPSGIKGTYAAGETHTLSIKKTNQTVIVTYDDKTFTYTDFDFVATDYDYAYICLFATRGVSATFSNVKYVDNGIGVGA